VLGVLVIALVAVAPASAGAVTTPTSAEITQMQAQVTADQPAANAEVSAAAANGTLATIVNQLAAGAPNAYGGPSPMDYALGVALGSYGSTAAGTESVATGTDPLAMYDTDTGDSTNIPPNDQGDPVTANYVANGSSCWYVGSHVSNWVGWKEAGVVVIKLTKGHNYWCGNGYSITSNGIAGFYSKPWAQFPWCAGDIDRMTGWDAPHYQWAHSRIDAHFGLLTPWFSCAGFFGSDGITLRIAANGHHDWYNDF